MDQPPPFPPYSPWADWLSKFHTWPELIQALWLVAGCATVLGVTYLVMRGVREIVRLWPRRAPAGGRRVYGVFQDRQGRWMVYLHGRAVREVDWSNPPPGLIGRDRDVHRFREPED